jgi:hypothetical protein
MAANTMTIPRPRISQREIDEYCQIEMAIYKYQLAGEEVTSLICPRCGGNLHFQGDYETHRIECETPGCIRDTIHGI